MLIVDSKDLTYNSNLKTYTLVPTQPLQTLQYEIDTAFIYKTFPIISAERGNNKFAIVGSAELTIPDGTYTSTTFRAQLETLLQTIDANFAVTINTLTNTFTITNTSAFKIDFDATTCQYIIGINIFDGESTAATSYTTPTSFNFIGFARLNLCATSNNIKTTSDAQPTVNLSIVNAIENGNDYLYYKHNPNDPQHYIINNICEPMFFTLDNEAWRIKCDNFTLFLREI